MKPIDDAARLIASGMVELPVTISHATRAMALPALHGDPVDRLLIAQALEDGLVLVTTDAAIKRYDVPTLDA